MLASSSLPEVKETDSMTAPTVAADQVRANVDRFVAEHTDCDLYLEEPPRTDAANDEVGELHVLDDEQPAR
jgi:hypothetical protein